MYVCCERILFDAITILDECYVRTMIIRIVAELAGKQMFLKVALHCTKMA